MALVKRLEKGAPISAAEYDAVVTQVEDNKEAADVLQGQFADSQVTLSFADLAAATAYWTAQDAASNTPSNNVEIYLQDVNQFWKWDSTETAKAVFSRDNPEIKSEPLDKTDNVNAPTQKTTADYIFQASKKNITHSISFENELFEYLADESEYAAESINASVIRTQTIIEAEPTFDLPFSKIFRNQFEVPTGVLSAYYLTKKIAPRKTNFSVNVWFSDMNVDGNDISNTQVVFKTEWRKGINDGIVKTLTVGLNATVIDNDVLSQGYYEISGNGYIARCNGMVTDSLGKRYWNLSVYYTDVPTEEVDYINVSIGNNGVFARPSTSIIDFTGIEIYDYQPIFTTDTINDFYNGEIQKRTLTEQVSRDIINSNNYRKTYLLDNLCKDFFDGGMKFSDAYGSPNSSLYSYGEFSILENGNLTKIDSDKFGVGYKVDFNNVNLPIYISDTDRNYLLSINGNLDLIIPNELEGTSFGFWINREELGANTLQFTEVSGAKRFVKHTDLSVEGFVETRWSTGQTYVKEFEVLKVDGNYSYLICRVEGTWNISLESNNGGIKSLTFYNPTILKGDIIDPYFIYKSTSEKNNSKHRGKTIMSFGDSQQNDRAMIRGLAKQLGVNIITASLGGHSMKYRNDWWMYRVDYRKQVLAISDVDIYFFMVSSNDGAAGGDISETAVNNVISNYYYDGDDAATEASKQSIFDALTEQEKIDLFGFKQTYSAYLKQLQVKFPDSKFLLATIPISLEAGGGIEEVNGVNVWKDGESPDTARTSVDALWKSNRSSVLEIQLKHNTHLVDLFLESGITYENFPSKMNLDDSVHWSRKTKEGFTNSIEEQVKKM